MEFIRRFYIFSSTIIETDRGNMAQKTNFYVISAAKLHNIK